MKKLFATALMAMSMGSVFAQGNIIANDTVKTDTTKNCPAQGCQKSLAALISNDTVTTDSTKAKLTAMLACVAMNDTVTTDSTKSAPAALVALNDTVTTDSAKAQPAALVAANDTVVTDSTKAQPAKPTALVAMIEEKDTTQTKDAKTTPSTCDNLLFGQVLPVTYRHVFPVFTGIQAFLNTNGFEIGPPHLLIPHFILVPHRFAQTSVRQSENLCSIFKSNTYGLMPGIIVAIPATPVVNQPTFFRKTVAKMRND